MIRSCIERKLTVIWSDNHDCILYFIIFIYFKIVQKEIQEKLYLNRY